MGDRQAPGAPVDLVAVFISVPAGNRGCRDQARSGPPVASNFVAAETMEARMIDGEDIDIATSCQLAATTVRISTRLGLDRRLREIVRRSAPVCT